NLRFLRFGAIRTYLAAGSFRLLPPPPERVLGRGGRLMAPLLCGCIRESSAARASRMASCQFLSGACLAGEQAPGRSLSLGSEICAYDYWCCCFGDTGHYCVHWMELAF